MPCFSPFVIGTHDQLKKYYNTKVPKKCQPIYLAKSKINYHNEWDIRWNKYYALANSKVLYVKKNGTMPRVRLRVKYYLL